MSKTRRGNGIHKRCLTFHCGTYFLDSSPQTSCQDSWLSLSPTRRLNHVTLLTPNAGVSVHCKK